mgnify:CR=1 FL=1
MTKPKYITICNGKDGALSGRLLVLRPGSLKGAPELLGAGRGATQAPAEQAG